MDPRERFGGLQEAMQIAMDGRQAGMWTAIPGIIESFDATEETATVQPTVKGIIHAPGGTAKAVDLPLLPDVPVYFPSGGGVTLTFPVNQGDECLVIFSSRCIDGWWQSGGVQLAPEFRMHDLSDGFAFVGFKSKPNVIGSISTSKAQLRSDDGAAYVELDPSSHDVNINTSGNAAITATKLTINADVVLNGNLSQPTAGKTATFAGDISINGRSFMGHTHPGDSGGTTGGVN